MMRARFAPSPTGNVHIGNIRVAIFNYLLARRHGGKFLLRIEDTDLERSTPEAIAKLQRAMIWLGLDHDETPLYQTARRPAHEATAAQLLAAGYATRRDDAAPLVLRLTAALYDERFISEPREPAQIKVDNGELFADRYSLIHRAASSDGEKIFNTPSNWDALTAPVLALADGREIDAAPLRAQCGDEPLDVAQWAGAKVLAVKFSRRFVFFDDLVLGRCEKPLDSLRDFVIARSDNSPVFHLANVVDDIFQNITHILRGNDHVENTFRHLFLFRALGAEPPQYGHFPMIVNQSGKPYSKRDGDAYVGDFQDKGFLPEALFNYLALCGWAPGDDREIMSREELCAAFSLERVNKSAAQFDRVKLAWMNQQYLMKLPLAELARRCRAEAEKAGFATAGYSDEWFAALAATQRERLEKFGDFMTRCRYFFSGDFEFDKKAAAKNLTANDGFGLQVLREMREILAALPEWTSESIETAARNYAENKSPAGAAVNLNLAAQPLRVAVSGAAATPGIGDTLFLLGRETTLARIDRAIKELG